MRGECDKLIAIGAHSMKSFFLSITAIGLILSGSVAVAEMSVAECEAQIVANKNFQVLKGKLDLLHSANPPIEIMANRQVPTKKEKVAISLWVEEQRRCSAPGIAYHNSQSREVGAIYEQAYAEMYLSAADLHQGKITYGDFAKSGVRRHQEIKARISAIVERFFAQKAERERQEAMAREMEEERQREVLARENENRRQKQLQILMMMQQQQQGQYQQQQYQQQREDYLDQACLNRARNPSERASCSMQAAGRQLGNALAR
jgi:flagellar biosynthesis GTPase FlhF